ncbi:MAG: hypothetical protein ABI147_10395 [Acidobacteriaceae bacterium]
MAPDVSEIRSESLDAPSPFWAGPMLRLVIVVALSLSVLAAAVWTAHWPIVGDAPLLHYVAFLIDHGKVPYRDIVEIDMPGTYALEWAAIHVLGPGAAAWRVFDFGLLAAAMAAMIAITWPVDWLAGFFGGAMFALIHFRDGPTHTGQRDLMMTVMALIGCAFLFYAMRKQRLWAAGAFGLFAGMAATIKPSGQLFFTVLVVLLWLRLRELHRPKAPYLAASIAGFAVPLLACSLYLVHHGAFGAFIAICKGIGAYHASLGRPALWRLVVGSFPSVLLAVAIPALPLFIVAKWWRQWEHLAITCCVVIGAASYIIQGKGFPYHRYPTEAFLLLLCGMVLVAMLKQTGWRRGVAVVGLLAGALYLAPASAAIARHYDWRDQEFQQMLTADLTQLGGPRLDGKVQCLEMAAECQNTLYNMRLMEATGYMYDCYMFQTQQTSVSLKYREDFWAAIHAHPPQVFVVTNQDCFTLHRGFGLTARWPQFQDYLQSEYTLATQRTPPHLLGWWRHPAVPFSYQLYVRNHPGGPSSPVASSPAKVGSAP